MYVFEVEAGSQLFPHPLLSDQETGLLAMSRHLSIHDLKIAYRFGIFPWYNPGEHVQWFFPHPRSVLFPEELHISKSMRPYLNGQKFSWTMNRDFASVIRNCAIAGQRFAEGTWIGDEIIDNYTKLHNEGLAHSIEVWQEGDLVGGFYGVWMGKVFFGESMFSRVSNASKYGFIQFVQQCRKNGKIELIDCQTETDHMHRLGARQISGIDFLDLLKKLAW